jgi:acyl-CoA reductase-like NAD-dependent aldehyde dehydrogenase
VSDLKPFTLLPNADTPAIVFASADADHAVLYVQDAAFKPQGEGKCAPSADNCRFVTLSTKESGNEEAFVSADGTQEYDIKLVSTKRQTLDPNAKVAAAKGKKGDPVAGAGKADAAASDVLLPILLGFTSSTTTTTTTHK